MLKWFRAGKESADGTGKSPRTRLSEYRVDPKLLQQALTHKSAGNGMDNERLEFLGDAVLEIIITEHLYRHFPEYAEGQLTLARVEAVSEPTLAEAARRLGLGKQLRIARGEEASGGRDRPSILSDAFEAVVAALYLSLGMEETREFVLAQIGGALGELNARDHKSRLQEYTQENYHATPTYRIVEQIGPPHDRAFVAEVILSGKVLGRGTGRSKKIAEQAAAEEALEGLTSCPTSSPFPETPRETT
jgi:ribonuclease-3